MSDVLGGAIEECLHIFFEWLHNPGGIFRIMGEIQSEKAHIYKTVYSMIRQGGLTPIFLAPNRRLASSWSDIDAVSIYSWLYCSSPEQKRDESGRDIQFYAIKKRMVELRPLPILFAAQLMGNDDVRYSDRVYGTGRLLSDFFDFIGDAPCIILGDPYQLQRNKSLLSFSPDGSIEFKGRTLQSFLLSDRRSSALTVLEQFQEHLAKSITYKSFNFLPTSQDSSIQIIDDVKKYPWQPDIINDYPNTVCLCDTHQKANAVNEAVKLRKLKQDNGSKIGVGDIIDFYNWPLILTDTGETHEKAEFIEAGSIGKVIKIVDEEQVHQQPLKGRSKPIKLRFQDIECSINGAVHRIRFLPDFFEAVSPELDLDYEIALMVFARKKVDEKIKNNEDVDSKLTEKEKRELVSRLIHNEPYINAAKIRPAFAMTVHRAQSRRWQNVWLIASRDVTNDSYTNESYFRWLYTAAICAAESLCLQKFPRLNPLSKIQVKRAANMKIGSFLYKDFNHLLSIKVKDAVLSKAMSYFEALLTLNGYVLKDVKETPYRLTCVIENGSQSIKFELNIKATGMISSMRILEATSLEIVDQFESIMKG